MPKHSMCPWTMGAAIWAHMLREMLFTHNHTVYVLFLFIAEAFLWVNICTPNDSNPCDSNMQLIL